MEDKMSEASKEELLAFLDKMDAVADEIKPSPTYGVLHWHHRSD